MSGSADLDFIRFYLPDYPPNGVTGSIEEAYGPRMIGTGEFGRYYNQIERAIERLREKPDTRRAVISILEPSDLEPEKIEAPCTTALQFIRRRDRLHMIAMMRSNDAFIGFTHDVFCFTMIQEFIARALGLQLGEYHHFATSLHLYEQDVQKVASYLDEGFQNPTFAMPKMPPGCQRVNLATFLKVEQSIRCGDITDAAQINLPEYWRDLALILLRHADTKMKRGTKAMMENFSNISDKFYSNFFIKKPTLVPDVGNAMVQDRLDLGDNDDAG
jgi:thymidylate synthase